MAGPDYILDIQSLGPQDPSPQAPSSFVGRPWLAVHWRCCSVYSRIYRNAAANAYEGRCPRCSRPLTVAIAPGGVSTRFFEAS